MRGLPPIKNKQTIIRSCLVAFGLFMSVRVTIPDYPWGESFFVVLAYDPNGWLHEIFYIWTFVLGGVAISAWYEWQQTLRRTLDAFLAMGADYAAQSGKVAPRPKDAHLVFRKVKRPQKAVLANPVENDTRGDPPS